MEGAADTKGKKEKTSSGGGGGFNESSLKAAMDKAGYTDKTERAMFLAQMAHETGNFKYAEEIHDGSNYEMSNLRLLCPNCFLSFNGWVPSARNF